MNNSLVFDVTKFILFVLEFIPPGILMKKNGAEEVLNKWMKF